MKNKLLIILIFIILFCFMIVACQQATDIDAKAKLNLQDNTVDTVQTFSDNITTLETVPTFSDDIEVSETVPVETSSKPTTSATETLKPSETTTAMTTKPMSNIITETTAETAVNTYGYVTPIVTASISNNGVLVSWNKISNRSLVGYKVIASQSNPNPKFPEDGYLSWITDADTTTCFIENGAKYINGDISNFSGGLSYYFSVTAVYTGSNPFFFPDPLLYPSDWWVKLAGNSVLITMPGEPYQIPPVTHPVVTLNDPTIGVDSANFSWSKTIDDTGFYCYRLHVEISKDGITYGTGCEIYDPEVTNWTISLSEFVAGSGNYSVTFTTVYNDYDGQTYNELSEVKTLVIP